jgi:hypothetical protein
VRALSGEGSDEQLEGEDSTDAVGADEAEESTDDDAAGVQELVDVEPSEEIDLESLVTDESTE